ncbi:MAG: SPOR domain-containing protein [Colwellia sp.]
MSTPFQNRLVGTVIVSAIIIIFLPDVLDGDKKSYQADFEAIPKAEMFSGQLTDKPFPNDRLTRPKITPVLNEEALDEVFINAAAAISGQADDKVKHKVAVTSSTAKPKVKLSRQENRTLPEKAVANEAWVIHLGSFRNKDNVAQLLKKLKSQGYVTFTKPIKTKQGILTQVIIGPELIKRAMIKKLPALKKLTGIQGKVAYFEVNK